MLCLMQNFKTYYVFHKACLKNRKQFNLSQTLHHLNKINLTFNLVVEEAKSSIQRSKLNQTGQQIENLCRK